MIEGTQKKEKTISFAALTIKATTIRYCAADGKTSIPAYIVSPQGHLQLIQLQHDKVYTSNGFGPVTPQGETGLFGAFNGYIFYGYEGQNVGFYGAPDIDVSSNANSCESTSFKNIFKTVSR